MNKLPTITEDKPVKKYEELDIVDKRIIDSMTDTFSMSKEQAIATYFDEAKWREFHQQNQRRFQVMFASLAEPLKDEIKTKIEKGSLEQVRAGMTALAIANDKWVGVGKGFTGPMFNVPGGVVKINLSPALQNWRPYQKTKVIEGEVEE